ncbi:MAG: hypothetical protein HKL80_07050 [Acidimicrobiales bacterium]|nr:hypothetical protein [Acidimicrobiales bacterium]
MLAKCLDLAKNGGAYAEEFDKCTIAIDYAKSCLALCEFDEAEQIIAGIADELRLCSGEIRLSADAVTATGLAMRGWHFKAIELLESSLDLYKEQCNSIGSVIRAEILLGAIYVLAGEHGKARPFIRITIDKSIVAFGGGSIFDLRLATVFALASVGLDEFDIASNVIKAAIRSAKESSDCTFFIASAEMVQVLTLFSTSDFMASLPILESIKNALAEVEGSGSELVITLNLLSNHLVPENDYLKTAFASNDEIAALWQNFNKSNPTIDLECQAHWALKQIALESVQENYDSMLELSKAVYEFRLMRLGAKAQPTFRALTTLGNAYLAIGQTEKAIAFAVSMASEGAKSFGRTSEATLRYLNAACWILIGAEAYDQAYALVTESSFADMNLASIRNRQSKLQEMIFMMNVELLSAMRGEKEVGKMRIREAVGEISSRFGENHLLTKMFRGMEVGYIELIDDVELDG